MNHHVMVGSSDLLVLTNIAFVTMLVMVTSVSLSDSSIKTKSLIKVTKGEGGGAKGMKRIVVSFMEMKHCRE